VILKRGPQGAQWHRADGATWSVGAVPVPSVDPTGAGDAFAAGLVHRWVSGDGPEAALRAAVTYGAAAVGVLGARPGGPARRW
jgi:ribokinase